MMSDLIGYAMQPEFSEFDNVQYQNVWTLDVDWAGHADGICTDWQDTTNLTYPCTYRPSEGRAAISPDHDEEQVKLVQCQLPHVQFSEEVHTQHSGPGSAMLLPVGEDDDKTGNIDASIRYECLWLIDQSANVCPISYSDIDSLMRHVEEVHIGHRQSTYVCCWRSCTRRQREFKQRQKISRHVKTHTCHKPFPCSYCGKYFAEKSSRDTHERTHTGAKPYQCSICRKRFSASTSMSMHRRCHTGERPHVCDFPGCGKRFSESSNFSKHKKTHSTAEMLLCPVKGCKKKYKRQNAYEKHLRTSHPDINST